MDSHNTKLIETARNISDSCCRNLTEIALSYPSLQILCMANRNIVQNKYRNIIQSIESNDEELAKEIISSMFLNSAEITLASVYIRDIKDIKPFTEIVKILSGGISHNEIFDRLESYME